MLHVKQALGAVVIKAQPRLPMVAFEPGRPPKVCAGMCHFPGPLPKCVQHIPECPRGALFRSPQASELADPDLCL